MATNIVPLRTVVFNEGEPLDPNKLNDLIYNITVAYDQAVKNSTEGTTLKMSGGTIEVPLQSGKGVVNIPVPANITSPKIVATVAGEIAADRTITLSVRGQSTNPYVQINSNLTASKTTINYIVFE